MKTSSTRPHLPLDQPLQLTPHLSATPDLHHWQRWTLAFFILGLAIRCCRYVLRFPLWEDECFLGVNIFERSYAALLEPLDRHQVAPILFLWLEKAVTDLLGFNELALRFPAFLCSIGSLFLFYHVVCRVISGPARTICLAYFAVSYPAARYTAEAKAYGTDLFISLLLVALLLEWLRHPGQKRWLAGLFLCTPLALGLSFPAVFTTAGLSLLWLISNLARRPTNPDRPVPSKPAAKTDEGGGNSSMSQVVRNSNKQTWGLWLMYNLLIAGSFGLIYIISIEKQMASEIGYMGASWSDTFPSINPLKFIPWFFVTHTGSFFAHPIGSDNGGSTLTFLLCVTGLIALFRNNRWQVALLLLGPLSMNLAAAMLQKFPYGGHVKYSMYAAPMITLTMGLGMSVLLNWHAAHRPRRHAQTLTHIVLLVLGCIGTGCLIRDVTHPYKTLSDLRSRAFAQWFWHNANFEDEAICVYSDLNRQFSEKTWHELGWSAMFLANKYIYHPDVIVNSPRHRYLPESQNLLYCVLYRDPAKQDFDQQKFNDWLAQMQQQHDYLGMDRYPVPRHKKGEQKLLKVNYIEIYKFKKRNSDD